MIGRMIGLTYQIKGFCTCTLETLKQSKRNMWISDREIKTLDIQSQN